MKPLVQRTINAMRSGVGFARRHTPLLACAVMLVVAGRVYAVTHLKRGMTSPPISLPSLSGQDVSTQDLDTPVVVVFGELYHQRTLDTCAAIRVAIERAESKGMDAAPLLVVAQRAPDDSLRAQAEQAGIAWPILRDTERQAFGAYRVTVMPSVVVIDRDHNVVHAMAGAHPRTAEIVGSAIELAWGSIEPDAFERVLHPVSGEPTDENRVHAERLTNLAKQLVQRQMRALALDKFTEAIEADPAYSPARVGLGMLHVNDGRLAEAEMEFRAALETSPNLAEASVGLSYVQSLRGGEELAEAEQRLRAVLATNPDQPLGLYVMGLIHEQREDHAAAAASFKASAESLMLKMGVGLNKDTNSHD